MLKHGLIGINVDVLPQIKFRGVIMVPLKELVGRR